MSSTWSPGAVKDELGGAKCKHLQISASLTPPVVMEVKSGGCDGIKIFLSLLFLMWAWLRWFTLELCWVWSSPAPWEGFCDNHILSPFVWTRLIFSFLYDCRTPKGQGVWVRSSWCLHVMGLFLLYVFFLPWLLCFPSVLFEFSFMVPTQLSCYVRNNVYLLPYLVGYTVVSISNCQEFKQCHL